MSGLLALLDDVAAIAKVTAASVDDIATTAAKVSTKTVAILVDDAAVTPKYVAGLSASRELPIIWRIALGSFRNKLLVLLPGLLILREFLPQVITPLLMLGGLYLCFEGAEKVIHWIMPHADAKIEADLDPGDPAKLEESRIAGAIKTDFILSAEIMTIALTNIPESVLWKEAAILTVLAIGVTVAIYGVVALIVKLDDMGLFLARNARSRTVKAAGRGMVLGVPKLLNLLSFIGTLAMLWVGGNIVTHGLAELGWPALYDGIHHLAENMAGKVSPQLSGVVAWLTTALADGILGVILGTLLIPVTTRVIVPLFAMFKRKDA